MSRAHRRGSALVVSLIAIVTLAAMGAAFLRITTSLTSRQTDDVENMKAFYLAEAGLAEGFQAVRMGRTGQLGSQEAPAVYGDGLLWVDAATTVDEQVRLESTALVGRGRASLAYVVEPVEVPLGFFGDQELVVESVLLVDGYDSTQETYAEASGGQVDLVTYALFIIHRAGQETVASLIASGGDAIRSKIANAAGLDAQERAVFDERFPALESAFLAGTLFPNWPSLGEAASSDPDEVMADALNDFHSGEGGLLGSNGDVRFLAAPEEPVCIYGDITPGPRGSTVGLDGVRVTGSTTSRPQRIDLPEVVVPPVDSAAAIRHAGLLPLLVPAGTVGYERIEVAADAELILQGPATVVIGTLILESGATLSLDTRDGDVALYITAEMDLQPGSLVMTSEDSTAATIQVSEIENGPGGVPIQLDATADFHGTIYAPETDVRIGGEFEVFGGVIARRLEIASGARLHFDNAGFESSPIPRIVSWKILEIPTAVRGVRDPFERLALTADELTPLAQAHDLARVEMVVTFLDHGGSLRTYEGLEDAFDWDVVAEVIEVDRDPERELDPDDATKDPSREDPVELLRADIGEALDSLSGVELRETLLANAPLNGSEIVGMLDAKSLNDGGTKAVLQASSPISDKVALYLVEKSAHIESASIVEVLLANSPLSPAVLDALRRPSESRLTDADRASILAANR